MNLTAQANYLRMSPRKVQLVTRLIAGLSIDEALAQLAHSPKLASTPITKLIKSAVANTLAQLNVEEGDLYVKEITVGQGPTLQRYKPRAFGRAGKIRKRTSNVKVTLGVREEAGIDLEKAKIKQDKIEKPTNLEDLEKEMAKEVEKAKKDGASKKDSGEKDDEAAKDLAQKSRPQSGKPGSDGKQGKGSDSKFMKKMFSRKVG